MPVHCYVCGGPGQIVRFQARCRWWEVPLCSGHREPIWLWHWLWRQLKGE